MRVATFSGTDSRLGSQCLQTDAVAGPQCMAMVSSELEESAPKRAEVRDPVPFLGKHF